jgi:hypothetical protein
MLIAVRFVCSWTEISFICCVPKFDVENYPFQKSGILDMPSGNLYSKRNMAMDTPYGMLADDFVSNNDFLCVKQHGFIGGIGIAPIAPTTFVFGCGTTLRTRNG